MGEYDLERVSDELAIIKGALAQPVVPREEIGVSLVVAAACLALAAAVWLVSDFWLKLGVVAVGAAGIVAYFPWKLRILRRELPRRRIEAREFLAWGIAMAGMVAYLIVQRFGIGDYTPEAWRRNLGAMIFFVGLGLAASGVLQPSRRYMMVAAAPLVVGGILTEFVSTRDAAISIVGVSAGLGCLLNAAGLARKPPGLYAKKSDDLSPLISPKTSPPVTLLALGPSYLGKAFPEVRQLCHGADKSK